MRRLSFFTLYILMLVTACSGTSNSDDKNKTSAPKEGVVNQLDDAAFRQLVWDYKNSPQEWKYTGDQPAVIDFYADWCRPCKMVAPIMEDLAAEYKGKIRFYKINTDQQRELAGIFRVNSIPAIMFIPKSGKPQMSTGAMPKENYVKAINEIIMVK